MRLRGGIGIGTHMLRAPPQPPTLLYSNIPNIVALSGSSQTWPCIPISCTCSGTFPALSTFRHPALFLPSFLFPSSYTKGKIPLVEDATRSSLTNSSTIVAPLIRSIDFIQQISQNTQSRDSGTCLSGYLSHRDCSLPNNLKLIIPFLSYRDTTFTSEAR